ncbi:hypothetical protein TRAPUB_1038 [Trametes pubescens]|uniref:Uncharacterized protein n=1 Tax=Trametes pubescens TaxID=154538 RepID=A0A1M2VKN8_TRAPU|nr:hypothetical protein TRAPUB_1038 [Trametes pubescens]
MSTPKGSPTPWSYLFIRLLFKFVLKIFYGTIVVENADLIPPRGTPWLTAKATQFGRKNFTSWLIESAGTVPLMRRKDAPDGTVDNSHAMKYLVEDNPELLAPVNYDEIRTLTAKMHQQISSGTLDAPSWRLIRIAKLAARMYAPLGTTMSLGDYVRVVRTFLEAFKAAEQPKADPTSDGEAPPSEQVTLEDRKILQLGNDLKEYQDQLSRWGIKDDRIRRPLPRPVILYRIFVRLIWSLFLIALSIPGLILWLPVYITTFIAVHQYKRTGPVWDTYDEIAQYKLTYGLVSYVCVYFTALLATLPVAFLTAILVPAGMWMSLRWTEDAVAAFRAFMSLSRLLRVGKPALEGMRERRADLHARVMALAVGTLGLPEEPETYFAETGGVEKGRVRGRWASKAKYFSVRRRRKRDWNETLRLYDQVDYPGEEY